MKKWEELFRDICEEMKIANETKRDFPEMGYVVWEPNTECPNCHNKGVFHGRDLEYGEFYECAYAWYCPACKRIYGAHEGANFSPYGNDFLLVMRAKLMKNPIHIEYSRPKLGTVSDPGDDKPCPICGWKTHTFTKDLGAVDRYDNTWTVCINPNCNWPGEHFEEYNRGEY